MNPTLGGDKEVAQGRPGGHSPLAQLAYPLLLLVIEHLLCAWPATRRQINNWQVSGAVPWGKETAGEVS